MHSRRDFLKYTSLASAAALTPRFLQGLAPKSLPFQGRRLVVVQLSGGNDGLNTIIPYGDDRYYRLRNRIAIPEREIIPLGDLQGFHPALSDLRDLYDAGEMTILNTVGYPNPNRSHFRSMDIWHSGSSSQDYWDHGWLGRYLDHKCSGCAEPHRAIETSDGLSMALKGEHETGLAMRNPQALARNAQDPLMQTLGAHQGEAADSELGYLYKTLTSTLHSAEYLMTTFRRAPRVDGFPNSDLGRQLALVARLMMAGVETSVFYVSISGFDTHVRQQGIQQRLLQQYAAAVKAFREVLQRQSLWKDTLVMTFSEFGRRAEDNAGGGTDHGKANNLFLQGGALQQPGIFNASPDLGDLDEGDLKWQIDFRQVYATILGNWLGADANAILGAEFAALPLV